MGVDLATYRARIGSFRNPGPDSLNCWAEASCLLIWVVISQLMLKLAGDVEENPGPKHKTKSKVKKEDEPSTPSVAQCQTKPSKLLDSQPDVQDHKQKQSGPNESDALGVEENGCRASKEVDPQRQADVSSDWASWSVEDVATWLKRIGIKDQHVEALQEVEVDGQSLDKAKEFKKLLCVGEKTLEGFVHRILVANGPEYPKPSFDEFRDLYDFIVDIPFTAVFDFDAESTTNGLHKLYDCLMTEREDSTCNVRILEPDSFSKNIAMTSLDFYQDTNFPKEVCWIMSNGWINSNSNKREEPMDLQQWTEARGRGITEAMIKYTDPGINQEGRVLILSEGEQDWFRTKFEQLEVRNIPEISLEDMMSFNLFKEGFNEDYVRRTVSKYLDRVTPKERELISYIALLNVFLVDKSLPALLCDTFMPGGSKWEQKLSEAANILLMKVQDSQSSIGAYKVKHPKIAEETLNQAIHDRQALSLITEHFLKCSMFKERSFAVKYLMEMTDQIFKHRTWKQTSHQAERSKKKRPAVDVDPREEGDEERETFSALVQRIITQEDCEAATIYKEDDELASFDSEFRKLLLAKRKLQKYIELYIKYFGEYEATPPSYIRHPPDMCNWRRRKVICKNGNNFREVFQMAKDQKYDDLREIRKLLGQNEPKTCFDLQHLIAVMLALSRHESPEEAIMSYMEVVKLSEEFVQVYHDHDISRMKAFFYVTMLMWPRKEMLLEFNLTLFERYLGELSELGKSTLFYRGNQLQHGRASGFRPAKKVYFYLGKGLGLHAFIHVTHFSGDDRERGMIPFWESPQAKDLLRRVNGRLIEYNTIHAVNPFNPNKPIRVQLARPERERFVNRKPVNFILGFSWSGPLAFNVLDDHIQEETPEITESVIYELEEEAASASGGMDFGSSMVPSDYTGVQERFSPYSDHVHRPQDTRRPMPTYREPTGTPPQENSSTKRIRC
ncbi:SAMD9 [Branchiostoma lanceolatum]|uniref:SAMD9 protein n=1 Tax=Branchiostoma lanceolatum TaxID=7740 RepID=A0A8K0F275_BRALA|nr:SAMD9 [Branchiostoma lanceolatum]